MNELINIQEHKGQKVVDVRELHYFMESKRDFSNWIKDRIKKYDFIENQDYTSFNKIVERVNGGGTTRIEYALTMDMAEKICALSRSDKALIARQYFEGITGSKVEMNNVVPVSDRETMTSLEIAELTGKSHAHLMRDIRKMEEAWYNITESKFGLSVFNDKSGRELPMY